MAGCPLGGHRRPGERRGAAPTTTRRADHRQSADPGEPGSRTPPRRRAAAHGEQPRRASAPGPKRKAGAKWGASGPDRQGRHQAAAARRSGPSAAAGSCAPTSANRATGRRQAPTEGRREGQGEQQRRPPPDEHGRAPLKESIDPCRPSGRRCRLQRLPSEAAAAPV